MTMDIDRAAKRGFILFALMVVMIIGNFVYSYWSDAAGRDRWRKSAERQRTAERHSDSLKDVIIQNQRLIMQYEESIIQILKEGDRK